MLSDDIKAQLTPAATRRTCLDQSHSFPVLIRFRGNSTTTRGSKIALCISFLHLSHLCISVSLHLSHLCISVSLHLSHLFISPSLHLWHLSRLFTSPCLHLWHLSRLFISQSPACLTSLCIYISILSNPNAP